MTPHGPRQLGLSLALPPAMGRADFLPLGSHALALAAVDAPGGLPGGRLVICGPEGSGKTHLASIWTGGTGALWLEAGHLARDLPMLLAPGGSERLTLDGAEAVAGDPQAEEALFHLLNHLSAAGGQILLTADRPAGDWSVALPDLRSRLVASAHVALDPPDDALLAAVLVKLFADRQISPPPGLIDWLVRHIERSFAAARQAVARIDAEALRLRRPVTRALAQEVLGPG